MTYSPGNPGYPPVQSRAPYGPAGVPPTPSFAKTGDGAGKIQIYLTAAVVVLGLTAYLASFGTLFTSSGQTGPFGVDLPSISVTSAFNLLTPAALLAAVAALLAALLAAVSLLPRAKSYVSVIAVIAVLGALLAIAQTVSRPNGFAVGWALWLVLACAVVQAIVAAFAALLEAGVVTPPAPRPKYGQYGQYGQYGVAPGGYYAQPGGQHAPYQQHTQPQAPQQSGYGSQYGGYGSAPLTGGFPAAGSQTGQQGEQQGSPTPPTGFPSFSPPPSAGAGSGSPGQGSGNAAGQGGSGQHQWSDGGQGQQSQNQDQSQSPSSPSGSAQS